jgi:hypothetical protein
MRTARACEIGVVGTAVLISAAALGGGAVRAQSSIENRLLAAEPGRTLTVRIGDNVQTAQVSHEQISSVPVDLRRADDRLSGRVGDQDVDLVLEYHHVSGDVGGQPVSLDVLPREPRALTIAGRFGSRSVALEIKPAGVVGAVGPCSYRATVRGGAAYVGQVACGGPSQALELRFPAVFVARSDVELAATLTAILAR